MYCNNCGAPINEGLFCSKCGANITSAVNAIEKDPNELNVKAKILTFKRYKSLGESHISSITSTVNITNTILTLFQQKRILFFDKAGIKTTHNIMDIASMKTVRTFDSSYTIFSVIFAISGFFNPIAFIMTIMLFWLGMGQKIQITKSNGATISIPSENNKACSELSALLSSINIGIVVQ